MGLAWTEKQCVFCKKGKGVLVRCPTTKKLMVMDFEPCLACIALHEGKVVVAEALAEDEVTGRHVVLDREAADKLLIPSHVQYAMVDAESYVALFDGVMS